jgi:hypothetical protein
MRLNASPRYDWRGHLMTIYIKGVYMKITKAHYGYIAQALDKIRPWILQSRIAHTKSVLSDKRFQWEMVRDAGLIPWINDVIYPYANDDHINTALRKYFRGLEV